MKDLNEVWYKIKNLVISASTFDIVLLHCSMSGLDSPLRDQYTRGRAHVTMLSTTTTLNHNSLLLVRYNFQATIYTLNRASWSGGKGTSAEVPAITSSNSGHSGFNMVSVWPPGPSSLVPVGRGEIVGLSERSGFL